MKKIIISSFMLLAMGTLMAYGQNKENIEETETGGIVNGHEYVDLGLSAMWATCNLGASSPHSYGDFYSWGIPHLTEENSMFDCPTYMLQLGDISGIKRYDAARVNWGGHWRMPTAYEFIELIDTCEWVWTTLEGREGYEVIGSNGNSIFLPAAGCKVGRLPIISAGDSYLGAYWCSMPDVNDTRGALYLFFDDESYYLYGEERYVGMRIRPVNDLGTVATAMAPDDWDEDEWKEMEKECFEDYRLK